MVSQLDQEIAEANPDNEVRQLFTFVNRFLVEFTLFVEAMAQIAQGELDPRPLRDRMAVTQSFKAPNRTSNTLPGRPN